MKTRGEISMVVLVVLGLLGASQLVPNFRPTNWFKKGPPTAELAKAQEEAAKARKAAQTAQEELSRIKAEQAQKVQDLTRSAQQQVAGIPAALKDEPKTAGVVLATRLAYGASDRLAAAIGNLPLEQQEEILRIVADAKSADAERIAAAEKALATKDVELRLTIQAKDKLEAQLPALQQAKDAAEAKVTETAATVAQKTQQVVIYAEKAALKEKEAGSLSAQLGNVFTLLLVLGCGYIFAHFILPSLAAEFPSVRLLTLANKAVKSIASAHE